MLRLTQKTMLRWFASLAECFSWEVAMVRRISGHSIRLMSVNFFIDRTPVTNAQFAQFLVPKVLRLLTDKHGTISMTTTRGFTDGEATGWRMRALRIIRWWKRHGTAPWLTVHGLESGCLPKPSGKKPHGAPMAENIRGETRYRIGTGRIWARVGTISDPSGAYRKARVPMIFWI